MMPGCMVMVEASGDILYFSQFLPATIKTESVIACPERLVPAALKVTGTFRREARRSMFTMSFSSGKNRRRFPMPSNANRPYKYSRTV